MSGVVITINGILLIFVFALSIWLLRLGIRYSYEYGRNEIQTRLKWRILVVIISLATLGLIASLFNLVVAMIEA